MTQILTFPMRETHVSAWRDRKKVLSRLLPKFLGILWEHGTSGGLVGGISAQIGRHLQISGSVHSGSLFILSAYMIGDPRDMNPMDMRDVKVFSAHLRPASSGDPELFKYWDGQCALLSWRRGAWEDSICDHFAAPRTVAHLLMGGFTKRG